MSKRLIALALIGLHASSALSAELLFGNVVLTRRGFLNEPGFAMEYRPNGVYRQFFNIPRVQGHVQNDLCRDVVIDRYGRMHVYNGTGNTFVSTLRPWSGEWTHTSIPGANSYPIETSGKLDMFWDYLFMTDHKSGGGDQTSGIVRWNVVSGSWVRFGDTSANRQPLDVTVGNNGLLYVLTGTNSPSGDKLDIYDPVSLQIVQSFDFYQVWQLDNRHIAADASGNIYIVRDGTRIHKLSPQAQLLQTLTLNLAGRISDIDINRSGEILVATDEGEAIIVNSDFEQAVTFPIFTPGIPPSYGAWVDSPVPEPMTLTSLGLAMLTCLKKRRNTRIKK